MNTPPVIELREYEKRTDIDLQLDEKDQQLSEELKQKGILTITGDPISHKLKFEASSLIGVAQFTNFTVTINPKFTNIENLVKLINYVYDLDIDILPESEVKFRNESDMLTEIIISSFLNQCKNLIRQGLYKSYVIHQERNMPCLRGKLLLVQQLQNDARKNAKFACEFDELEYNNLENQILLYCLHKCSDWTIIDSKKNELHSLIQQIAPLVNYEQITIEHFKKINYTRLNQYYEKIHQLCQIIVQNMGISDFYEQKTSFVNSFFVDMNKIFEKFFFKFVQQYYPLPSKEQVSEVAWVSTLNEKFSNEPDILIYNENRTSVKYILDTKYKFEVKHDDLRQVDDYMQQHGKNDGGFLIYPKIPGSKTKEWYTPQKYRNSEIKVRFIDIDKAIDLIYTRDSSIRKEKIREYFEEIIN